MCSRVLSDYGQESDVEVLHSDKETGIAFELAAKADLLAFTGRLQATHDKALADDQGSVRRRSGHCIMLAMHQALNAGIGIRPEDGDSRLSVHEGMACHATARLAGGGQCPDWSASSHC